MKTAVYDNTETTNFIAAVETRLAGGFQAGACKLRAAKAGPLSKRLHTL